MPLFSTLHSLLCTEGSLDLLFLFHVLLGFAFNFKVSASMRRKFSAFIAGGVFSSDSMRCLEYPNDSNNVRLSSSLSSINILRDYRFPNTKSTAPNDSPGRSEQLHSTAS